MNSRSTILEFIHSFIYSLQVGKKNDTLKYHDLFEDSDFFTIFWFHYIEVNNVVLFALRLKYISQKVFI